MREREIEKDNLEIGLNEVETIIIIITMMMIIILVNYLVDFIVRRSSLGKIKGV